VSARPFRELLAASDERRNEELASHLRSTPDPDEPHVCGPHVEEPCPTCRTIDELEADEMFSEADPDVCYTDPDSPWGHADTESMNR
jgi:hypothetical protein